MEGSQMNKDKNDKLDKASWYTKFKNNFLDKVKYKYNCLIKSIKSRVNIFYRRKVKVVFSDLSGFLREKLSCVKDPKWRMALISVSSDKIKNTYKVMFSDLSSFLKEKLNYVKDPKRFVALINTSMNSIKFRYNRFVGTTKHKAEIFYHLKFTAMLNDLSRVLKEKLSFVRNHKRRFALISASVVVISTTLVAYNYHSGYEVTFNGDFVGYVKDQEVFNEAIAVLDNELSEKYGENVVFDCEVNFEKTFIDRDQLLEDVDASVKAMYETDIDVAVMGAAIVVDGEEVVFLNSEEEAAEVLAGVLEPYTRQSDKVKVLGEPEIEEDVEIVEKEVNYFDISNVDDAISLLSQGTNEIKEYTVKAGDTSWDIAVNRGIDIEQLEKANPDQDISNLHEGDVLKLEEYEPYLTVQVVKEEITEEKIDYDTEYEEDSSMYVGKTKVIEEGKEGIKQVTAQVVYKNGEEISREVIEEEVLKEPVNEVVAKGTKALPPGKGTGQFRLPTSGRVSAVNKAGSHSGSKAVDIANSIGTPIYAADSGTVTQASNTGNGYGNCVIIDHGNGYSTLYGHLSSIQVSVGQSVSSGQKIATMGSTGNSTGSHLHFEVRLYGERQVITNYFAGLVKGAYVSP